MKTKKRILLSGATGKMGREFQSLLKNHKHFVIGAGLAAETASHESFPVYESVSKVPAKDVDLIIDFSLADFFSEIVNWAQEKKLPLVSGTTGIKDSDHKLLKRYSKKIPILWSPNMSIGVAILKEALKSLSPLEDFNFQVEEFHHNKKLDNPSGTALSIQMTLENTMGRKLPPPIGIRGGGIFGIHNVHVMGEEETLLFQHVALNRSVFAKGALHAAEWLVKQGPGLYNLQDSLR